ncbi:MAG: ABC transporter ATP-binding protein [Candidatus Omnitrophica bacterium]|nr:ABC transporter ATP-binding protein [Candidatus Omnitrophota bacterium]
MAQDLLALGDLTVTVREAGKEKTLLDNVSLKMAALGITALVGGSGSGKTTTGLAILRLLPPGLIIRQGRVLFLGEDLLGVSTERIRDIRGKDIAMIFQEPLHAFNPVFSIGYQIEEVLQVHSRLNLRQRRERVLELLDMVGLPDPKRTAGSYPHQLSGGMRQRAMIAQAMAGDPKLIIADEPTSNLDVTLQARIMELFRRLKDKFNLSILLITHDLGMVARMADQVAVMKEGKVVEEGATKQVLGNPRHEYTRALMAASGLSRE